MAVYIRIGSKSYPLMYIQLRPSPIAIVVKNGRLTTIELECGRELAIHRAAIQRFL